MREETLHTSEREPKNARDFLEKLKNREAIEGDSRIAVVVAHQDDESIAFGAQIQRFPNCLMVHVTDGAPANPKEWKTKGFKNQAEYAEVRNTEVNTALDRARHTGKRVSLNVPDQQAALNLTQNAEALALFFAENNIRFVLTHAYEGGHPDHDATAFAVHTAQKLLEKENIPISVIEAPLYRMKGDKSVWQEFVPLKGAETFTLPLTKEESDLKKKLFDAHASQRQVFAKVSSNEEWLREAPDYNFRTPPNEGNVSHNFADAGIPLDRWLKRTENALTAFGL